MMVNTTCTKYNTIIHELILITIQNKGKGLFIKHGSACGFALFSTLSPQTRLASRLATPPRLGFRFRYQNLPPPITLPSYPLQTTFKQNKRNNGLSQHSLQINYVNLSQLEYTSHFSSTYGQCSVNFTKITNNGSPNLH